VGAQSLTADYAVIAELINVLDLWGPLGYRNQ